MIAVDENVPRGMDAGGTDENPARYVIGDDGAFSVNFGNNDVSVGTYNSYNHLVIQSGSTLANAGGGSSIGWSGSYNRVTVTDPGSAWTTSGDGTLIVGWHGSHNQLIIENGGRVTNSGFTDIGRGETGSHNSVTIRGTGSVWKTDPIYFAGGGHHTLTIADGGRLETGTGFTWLGQNSYENNVGNRVLVTGTGSVWHNEGSLMMNEVHDASLTIENGGLVTLENTNYGLYLAEGLDSFIRFNGGSLALWGDHVTELNTYISDGLFQYWNGEGWAFGSAENFILGRFNESEAFALTGYSGLAGYTIVTNIPVSPIPEPSTYAALAGLAALGLAIRRRRARFL